MSSWGLFTIVYTGTEGQDASAGKKKKKGQMLTKDCKAFPSQKQQQPIITQIGLSRMAHYSFNVAEQWAIPQVLPAAANFKMQNAQFNYRQLPV